MEEVNEKLAVELPEDEDFETIGGFVCSVLGRIPAAGESFEYNGTKVEILAAGERSVEKLRLEILPAEDETAETG